MAHRLYLVSDLALRITAISCLLAFVQSEARSQAGPPPGQGSPAINNPKISDQDREIREGRLRGAEFGAAAENNRQKLIEETISQVKQDFTRIQVIRNQIAHNLVARVPLDYRTISDQTSEIHKRASRLKTFMMPPNQADKENEKVPADLAEDNLTSALVRLCKLIDGFVENPALKNAGTLDAQQLDQAKRDKARADSDLLTIIDLSSAIRQSAQKHNPQ